MGFSVWFLLDIQIFTARFRLLVQGCLQTQLIKASFNLNELIKGLGEKGSTSKAKAKGKTKMKPNGFYIKIYWMTSKAIEK